MTQHAGDAPARPAWLDHLAHDLRSPLAPLTSGIAMLRSGGLDAAQQAEILTTMQRQIDALAQLADDTADLLGRRSNGALAPAEMASLLDMVGVRVFRRFEEARVAFEGRPPAGSCTVACDARSLVRLLAQLALASAQIAGAGNRVIADASSDAGGVTLRLMLADSVPDGADEFAAIAARWSNPAAPHVTDAAMRDIVARHGAQIAALGDTPQGIALLMPPAPAGD